jgi:hypothetical protein
MSNVIIVTGRPRSGTSMMMLCLHRSGIPLAFTPRPERKGSREVFGNPEGFFEGEWNSRDGLVKVFDPNGFRNFREGAKVIVMKRDPYEILKSWERVNARRSRSMPPEITPERIAGRFAEIEKVAEKMEHVVVDYARFKEDPETHRKKLLRLLPNMDWDAFRSGVDTEAGNRAARVRFRIKGNEDGPIYEGQRVYAPCKSCS